MLDNDERQAESKRLSLWGWRGWTIPIKGNNKKCHHCRRWFPRDSLIDYGTGFENTFTPVTICPGCVMEQYYAQISKIKKIVSRAEIDRNNPRFRPDPPKHKLRKNKKKKEKENE